MLKRPARFCSALSEFADLLETRLAQSVFTTEDSIRYTFFVALMRSLGLSPHQIILEQPHPRIARAEIDTFIPALENRGLAVEFKYDRPIPSGRNLPRSQKEGSLAHVIFRLARFEADDLTDGLFVYLTSKEMAGYLANPQNGLADLFNADERSTVAIDEEYLGSRSQTLRGAAGPVVCCEATALLKRALAGEHELRVFDVKPRTRPDQFLA